MLANEVQMMLRLLGREQPRDDASGHRQERIPESRPDVRRMQQQLRRVASRLEDGVPRDRCIADEETVEVAAHGQRKLGERLPCILTTSPAQHVGVTYELLIQKSDGPAAHHRVAQPGIGRLQRIVPVALAVANQMGTRYEALANRREQLLDVDRDRVLVCGTLQRLVAAPRRGLVEKRQIVGGFEIVVERLQRPDDHIAVAVPVLNERVGLEHEPLRPVASRRVLLREDDPQDLLDRFVVFERQEEFDRSLADVAGSPRRTGVLLEPARHRQMDHRVVREPRQRRVEGRGVGALADDP